MADYDGGSQKIYAGMVTQMDVNIGKILRALDTNGIARNTIVVFSGRKTELPEGGLRIPAVEHFSIQG